ncbi:MAG: MBL fold metallo-hydrolase [Myxococcaceae bacterium]
MMNLFCKWVILFLMILSAGSAPFNGKRFENSNSKMEKSLSQIVQFLREKASLDWPEEIPLKQQDKPPVLIPDSQLRASFVNHATVLLQTHGLNFLTDPVWSKRASPFSFIGPKRVHSPGIDFKDLPKIDYVLISHNHYDHLDLETLVRLEKAFKPTFLVGLKVSSNLRKSLPNAKIIELDWGQAYEISNDKKIYFLPAQHWSARWPWDRNQTLWGAFAIQLPGGNIYFAGDTGYAEHFKQAQKQFGKFRLALLPIGAYEPRDFMKYQHMNPADAVQAAKDLKTEHALGIHFGCFPLATEAYDGPKKEIKRLKLPVFQVLEPGEFRFF